MLRMPAPAASRRAAHARVGLLSQFLKYKCFWGGFGAGNGPPARHGPPAFGAETGPESPQRGASPGGAGLVKRASALAKVWTTVLRPEERPTPISVGGRNGGSLWDLQNLYRRIYTGIY